MMHALDDPIWSALNLNHKHLAIGGAAALRYPPDISPFAAVASDDADALRALARLCTPGASVVLVSKAPIALPATLTATATARVLQMVATQPLASSGDPRLERLGEADEAAIYDLASLTKPGPFVRHTMRLGEFWA